MDGTEENKRGVGEEKPSIKIKQATQVLHKPLTLKAIQEQHSFLILFITGNKGKHEYEHWEATLLHHSPPSVTVLYVYVHFYYLYQAPPVKSKTRKTPI